MDRQSAEQYDAWYRTPRGAWIGDAEFQLLVAMLDAKPGERLLDVGCGTGYFTRRFARETGLATSGLDPNAEWIAYAAERAQPGERYLVGDARALPFADKCFDYSVCVTALCFIREQQVALSEILRVTRRRLVLGLLNQRSLLYFEKRGAESYRGAHWHTPREVRGLFEGLSASGLELKSAIFLPGGGILARRVETLLPSSCLSGGFLAATVEVAP